MPEKQPGTVSTALAFATCTLIWGSTFLVIRIGNDTVPPMWAATLRLVLAALVLAAIVKLRRRSLPRGAALRAAAGFGLFQFGLNMPLLYWAETGVPSGLAAVVYGTIPITTALIASRAGLETLEPLKMVGALVSVGGVAVLFRDRLATPTTALPVLAVYLATVSAALGSVLLKRGPRQDPIAANAVGVVVGAPVCLLASLLLHETRAWPTRANEIVPILYLAIVGSVGAFVIFAWLVNHWRVSSISFIGVIVPVIAVTLGALARGEEFHRGHLAGSALVMAGVLLAIASDRRTARIAASRPPR
jgi:drug/metabolite transporter (DMT)-like permease